MVKKEKNKKKKTTTEKVATGARRGPKSTTPSKRVKSAAAGPASSATKEKPSTRPPSVTSATPATSDTAAKEAAKEALADVMDHWFGGSDKASERLAFDESRSDANRTLLSILSTILEEYPTLRFSQALLAYGFVSTDTNNKDCWRDEFNLEPTELRKRVLERQLTADAHKITDKIMNLTGLTLDRINSIILVSASATLSTDEKRNKLQRLTRLEGVVAELVALSASMGFPASLIENIIVDGRVGLGEGFEGDDYSASLASYLCGVSNWTGWRDRVSEAATDYMDYQKAKAWLTPREK